MVAVNCEDYYHNFYKDSTVLTTKFKEKLVDDNNDSSYAIKLVKQTLQILENSFFVFKIDSTYQTNIGQEAMEEGKFTIDLLKMQLFTFSIGGSGINQEQLYHFSLNKNKLELSMASGNEDVIFYLEKSLAPISPPH